MNKLYGCDVECVGCINYINDLEQFDTRISDRTTDGDFSKVNRTNSRSFYICRPTLECAHFQHSMINMRLNSLHDKSNYSFST